LEVAFISNLGPGVVIVPVFVLPVVSILFAIGLRKALRPSSSKFATIGAAFFGASFVELLVGGILAPSLPGGFFTVALLAVVLLSVALPALGYVQWKSPEFPNWNAYMAFLAVVGFWTLSPLMSSNGIGLLAFSGRLVLFAAWVFASAIFLWRKLRTVAAMPTS